MEEVDVLICGGGPVGLLIGYCLARYGLSTYMVEKMDRVKQMQYSRAVMITPRCLEMLEQLDLADDLIQIGFIARDQMHYNNDGERVDITRYATSNITGTFYDYLLLVRQKYTEGVFHDGYIKTAGRSVHYNVKLVDYQIKDASRDFPVHSHLEAQDGTPFTVKSKYLVGADGARSLIRGLAGIQFEGEKSKRHFIRIDGKVRTNIPEARKGNIGIESPSYGSVIWAPLDHGITRIGIAFPEKLWEEKGANLTQDDVIEAAKNAVQPFDLEFETVEWWTAYSVGQRLATNYRANSRVFIAGDAGHTHSSTAAQGMNTGIHDAVNLAWKLAGCLKGWFEDSVLDSYTVERRESAGKIIDQDRIVASLSAGEIPKRFQDDPNFNHSETLSKAYLENQGLLSGVGIRYEPDGCTIVNGTASPNPKISPGGRAPDVLLQKPGIRLPVRLYTLFSNIGKFTVLLFCGDPIKTAQLLKGWRKYISGPKSYTHYEANILQYITVIATHNDYAAPVDKLGVEPFGRVFYDVDGSAHASYGLPDHQARVVILRPDGSIGFIGRLSDTVAVNAYFEGFLTVQKEKKTRADSGIALDEEIEGQVNKGIGEIDIELSNDRVAVKEAQN